MNFRNLDIIKVAEAIEARSPALMRTLGMKYVEFLSPFNRSLKASIKEWTPEKIKVAMKCHRKVQNHVGSIHAGALFTLGEGSAGLLIARNLSFSEFRPLMTEISAQFFKQARGPIYSLCQMSSQLIQKAQGSLERGEFPLLPMETLIFNEKDEKVAAVQTTWQIKPWNMVGVRPAKGQESKSRDSQSQESKSDNLKNKNAKTKGKTK